jgi:hypothetical protein
MSKYRRIKYEDRRQIYALSKLGEADLSDENDAWIRLALDLSRACPLGGPIARSFTGSCAPRSADARSGRKNRLLSRTKEWTKAKKGPQIGPDSARAHITKTCLGNREMDRHKHFDLTSLIGAQACANAMERCRRNAAACPGPMDWRGGNPSCRCASSARRICAR